MSTQGRPKGAKNYFNPSVTDTNRARCYKCGKRRYIEYMIPMYRTVYNRIVKYYCKECPGILEIPKK